ncbi:MAG TPA: cob(I)yrinic acid a,c-diamide adenosyltransferase [Candidatus Wirthbacteria bacterium]|nr:cob(I)yrinic acid a,c-diamide adenosyltransferase [Candidatus Wirthbacteria bacterium]
MPEKIGLIHIYTGEAKGKTTAALGLGLRAAGQGLRVMLIQFMKGQTNYGELASIKQLEGYEYRQFGRPDFVERDNPHPLDQEGAQAGLFFAQECMQAGWYDLLILDEVICALDFGLLDLAQIVDLVSAKPASLELVLTGRNVPPELIDLADYVTSMELIKHPYQQGIQARRGVEF